MLASPAQAQDFGRFTTDGIGVSATAVTSKYSDYKSYGGALGYVFGSHYEVGGHLSAYGNFKDPVRSSYSAGAYANYYVLRQRSDQPLSIRLQAKYTRNWSGRQLMNSHAFMASGALFRTYDLSSSLQLVPQLEIGYRNRQFPDLEDDVFFPHHLVVELAGSLVYKVSEERRVILTPLIRYNGNKMQDYSFGVSVSFTL